MSKMISKIEIDGNHNIIIQNAKNNEITINTIYHKDFIELQLSEERERINELKKLLQKTEDSHYHEKLKLSEKINDLESQIELKDQQIKEILEYYRGKDLAGTPPSFQNALKYFIDGQLDNAIYELDRIIDQRSKYQVESLILKGNFLSLQFNFSDAEDCYREVVDVDPSWDNYQLLSNHYMNLDKLPLAITVLQKSLDISPDTLSEAISLNNLGVAYYRSINLESAESCFRRASIICEELYKNNADSDLNKIFNIYPGTLMNLGNIYLNRNDIKEAESYYIRALKLFTLTNSVFNINQIADAHRNLGSLYSLIKSHELAQYHLKAALYFNKRVVFSDKSAYSSNLSLSYEALGIYYHDSNDYKNAQKFFRKALELLRSIENYNPSMYLQPLGTTLMNLGISSKNLSDFKRAEKLYFEALDIFRKLYSYDPESNVFRLCQILMNIGNLYYSINQFDLALKYMIDANDYINTLTKVQTEAFLPNIALNSRNIGNIYKDKMDIIDAIVYYQKSFEIYKSISRNNPETYLSELTNTLNHYVRALYISEDFISSEKLIEETVNIISDLPDEIAKFYCNDKAEALHELGYINFRKKNYKKAECFYKKSIELRKKQNNDKGHKHHSELGISLQHLSRIYIMKLEFDKAERLLNESSRIFRKLARIKPKLYSIGFVLILEEMVDLYDKKNENMLSKKYKRKVNRIKYGMTFLGLK